MSKQILYIDLDNTLVDFGSRLTSLDESLLAEYDGRLDEIPGIFALMRPVQGAIEAYKTLSEHFDTYILSTAPWENPSAWQHKIEWVHLHIGRAKGTPAWKRLILSHHKNLNKGDFLVDDRPNNGAKDFDGEWLLFGQHPYEDKHLYKTWPEVTEYLLSKCTCGEGNH